MIGAVLLAVTLQSFSQLPLGAAEDAAIAHSPDVAAARAKVDEQQALFDAARAAYSPALTANYAQSPQLGNSGGTVEQQLTTVGAQISLGDLFANSPAVAQAHATLLGAQFDLDNARRNERITVIGEYYSALVAHATLDARNIELDSAKAEEQAAQLRYRSGDAPKLDVVRASVAVAQAEADLARARAEMQNADAVLSTETGIETLQLQPQESSTMRFTLGPAPDPEHAITQALASRPEIASAQADVAAEEHAVAVARRGGLPLVTLAGGYTTGVDTGFPVHGASANVTMTYPVGGASHDRVVAEQARLVQAQAMLEKARRSVIIEAGSAARTYAAQTAALAAAAQAREQAQAEFDATETGYRNGASSSLDVESVRATYVQALVNEITALYAQAQAQATLELVVGSTHA